MKYSVIISALLLSCSYLCAREYNCNVVYSPEDSIRCEEVLNSHFSSNLRTTDIAKLFLGTSYLGGTLDREDKESVVVRLDSVDCTTFVETVTALTLCKEKDKSNFSDFVKEVENIRYRNGICNGYTSRLHYFSEWILNNQEMGIIEEILPINLIKEELRSINFMSYNANRYNNIKDNAVLNEIKASERVLSSLPFHYIPKDKVTDLTHNIISEGDIIAIVTDIDGLDISHVGFATYVKNDIHLLHASSAKNKVVIDTLILSYYLAKYKHHIGIKILRLK